MNNFVNSSNWKYSLHHHWSLKFRRFKWILGLCTPSPVATRSITRCAIGLKFSTYPIAKQSLLSRPLLDYFNVCSSSLHGYAWQFFFWCLFHKVTNCRLHVPWRVSLNSIDTYKLAQDVAYISQHCSSAVVTVIVTSWKLNLSATD